MKFTWAIAALSLAAGLAAAGGESPPSAHFKPEMHTDRGRVLFAYQWNFLLIDNGRERYRVSTNQGIPELRCGDLVNVRGVWGIRDGRTALESATYEHIEAPPEPPVCTDVDAERFGEFLRSGRIGYGSRLRLRARLVSSEAKTWGMTDYVLAVGNYNFHGWHDGNALPAIAEDSGLNPLVECVGILTFTGYDTESPEEIRLWIASPQDVRIIPDASLRKRRIRRLLTRSWIILPVLAAAMIVFLLFKFLTTRRERLLLSAVMEERQRMAADIHDTIEQHLAGASMFLDSVLPLDGSPVPEDLKPVETARDILMTAKREIRETVWNLHVSELVARRPEDVLRSLAVRAAESGAAKIRARLHGLPEHLPESVFSDLVFLVQEAVANALKHGHARHVSFVSDPVKGGFRLRVANDGQPFDVTAALIPEAGHFGLSGMRERARRSGIAIGWESNARHTVVSLEVKA